MEKPRVLVLTGAGISAESGIRTFRAADGLWEEHRVEDVATPEGFSRNPQLVQSFYNARRHQLQQSEIQPNAAHIALAKLEAELGDRFLLVTQNIDNLHERAGSQNVIHMHGELLKVRCSQSGQILEWTGDVTAEDKCHCCQFPAPLRRTWCGLVKCRWAWMKFIWHWQWPMCSLRLVHRAMYTRQRGLCMKLDYMGHIR